MAAIAVASLFIPVPRSTKNTMRLVGGMLPLQHSEFEFFTRGGCPLWVKSRHSAIFDACPLYPRKETLRSATSMSALCQKEAQCSAA